MTYISVRSGRCPVSKSVPKLSDTVVAVFNAILLSPPRRRVIKLDKHGMSVNKPNLQIFSLTVAYANRIILHCDTSSETRGGRHRRER